MKFDIVRAWKDESYRESLGAEAPESPIGAVELSDADLEVIQGGHGGDEDGKNTVALLCVQSVLAGCASFNGNGDC